MKRVSSLFFVFFFFFSLALLQHAFAYDKGDCKSTNAICYNGSTAEDADLLPGYQCGSAAGYVFDTAQSSAEGPNTQGLPLCSPQGGGPVGFCCIPTSSPIPTLPPHKGYDLGGNCASTSICYTGNYSQPASPGQQCGTLKGWYMGHDSNGGLAYCSLPQIGSICCDTTNTYAPSPPNPCPSEGGVCNHIDTALGTIDVTGPGGFIQTIFGLLLSFAGGIALILIIISGYRIMTAQGDPEKIKGAREMLTSAIIGLLFMIFSVAILQILGVDILNIPGFTK